MKKTYRVGVYRNAGSDWHGGQIYFDNLISLLSEASDDPVELVLIEKKPRAACEKEKWSGIPIVFLSDYIKEVKRRRRQKKWWQRLFPEEKKKELPRPTPHPNPPELAAFASIARDKQLDFVFPLPATASGPGVKGAGWIPDLQHCFLPDLFDPTEIETRNEMFRKQSEAGLIVFSSETSRDEFQNQYPGAASELKVWSFCSNPGKDLFLVEPSQAVEKYMLPERFFLVANQFWKHKDHAIVVEALVRLKNEGLSVPVVFTGALQDYRGTGHVDQFLQAIQRGGIHDSVYLLGFLDREEQLHLMRSALAVIQPSRFEGWSTVVEDCKALGQRLILSDLDVHREQAPPNSVFFPVGNSSELAKKIRDFLSDAPADWINCREFRESQAKSDLNRARIAARRRFLEIVELSQTIETQPIQRPNT